MQPTITRETIVDRRQSTIRWSAIFAGAAIAVGVWGLLQLIGVGVGLVAIDPDDATSIRPAAIGATAFSTLAPLIAMFVGGWVAARLTSTWDRTVAGTHAFVMWGVASVVGIVMTILVASAVGHGAARMDHPMDDDIVDARDQLDSASRVTDRRYTRDELIAKVDKLTSLDKDEAARVVDRLGAQAPAIVALASTPTRTEHDAMFAANRAGKGLLALGVSMLISVITALAGAMIALREGPQRRAPHTTAPYPVATPTE